ncbi:MAG: DUF4065 domain-containing protein [Methanobrevibacter millerae]|uniref:DUF4065 domain-containing protein n=1 Tax=Methanobrevibacter millerae TaxID=230361 RepID=A0A8T3VJZ0_9EURY|nr:type II toxin-antitoxin system antitoxin SocA domain-containing protein [Methanobrevibacter millerae]MBE6505583.1 DUF4065 domain-containing protein [Methanobrevibacter millerae]
MAFKKNEYTKLLSYILSNCYDKPHVGKTVIITALYFTDFNYYELYGKSLTKETYLKSKKGIQPKHFNKVTEELIERKKIFFRKEPYYHTTLHKYYLKEIPNIKYPEKKRNIINTSIRYLITRNATSLLKYVSNDPPFKNTDYNQEIDYNNVYFRDSRYSVRKKFINL